MFAGLQPSGTVPCGALTDGSALSVLDALPILLVALFKQASLTTIVKVRVEAQAVPPSTCVTLVESRLQLSLACTKANTAASSGMLAGLQASGTVRCGALIVGAVASAVQV